MLVIFCSLQNNAKATRRAPAKQMVKARLEQPCAEHVGYTAYI